MRSTWLAVGPGCDSLLLGSQNNTLALPAPLALLWSSNLVVLSSRCYSESLNAGRLSVITDMPEHLFGKQGKLSPWAHCLLGIPSFFTQPPFFVLYVWAVLSGF